MPKGRPVIVILRQPEVKALIRAARVGMVVLSPEKVARVDRALGKLEQQLGAVNGSMVREPADQDGE